MNIKTIFAGALLSLTGRNRNSVDAASVSFPQMYNNTNLNKADLSFLKDARDLSRHRGEYSDSLYEKGLQAKNKRKYKEAFRYFKEYSATYPFDKKAEKEMSELEEGRWLYFESCQKTQVRPEVGDLEILAEIVSDKERLLQLEEVVFNQGIDGSNSFNDRVEYLKILQKITTDSTRITISKYLIGETYYEAQDWKQAKAYFENIVSSSTATGNLLLDSKIYLNRSILRQAMQELSDVALEEDLQFIWEYVDDIYTDKRDKFVTGEVDEFADMAIDSDDEFLTRFQARFLSGRFVEAVEDITQYLEYDVDDRYSLSLRGVINQILGKEDEAKQDFEKVKNIEWQENLPYDLLKWFSGLAFGGAFLYGAKNGYDKVADEFKKNKGIYIRAMGNVSNDLREEIVEYITQNVTSEATGRVARWDDRSSKVREVLVQLKKNFKQGDSNISLIEEITKADQGLVKVTEVLHNCLQKISEIMDKKNVGSKMREAVTQEFLKLHSGVSRSDYDVHDHLEHYKIDIPLKQDINDALYDEVFRTLNERLTLAVTENVRAPREAKATSKNQIETQPESARTVIQQREANEGRIGV